MAIRKRSLDARCRRTLASVVLLVAALFLLPGDAAAARQPRLEFLLSFPAPTHNEPITGRAFVVLTRSEKSEPRLQAGYWGDAAPLFGVDVSQLAVAICHAHHRATRMAWSAAG